MWPGIERLTKKGEGLVGVGGAGMLKVNKDIN